MNDTGFFAFAPIYLNGLLAIFFVFVLPGLVFVRAADIPNFPQRWLAVFLGSAAFNHLFVTLIAALHLDPLRSYRAVTAALIAALLLMNAGKKKAAITPVQPGASIILASDVKWLTGGLVVLGFTYFNIWRHGVPNIFQGSDVSVSWNAWALILSHGLFPTASYGYPQFIPTTWAATYIFIGSTEQYFAFYTHIVLIIVPLVLCAAILGRLNWRYPLLLLAFVWLVAEIQEPWLRSTLQEGWPDWVAAIFVLCGAALFIVNSPEGRFDREKMVTAILSLCLVSIAAATKPIYGLFAIAILIAVCLDTVRYLPRRERNRLVIAAVGLLSVFLTAYAVNYSHLVVRSLPNYPVAELSERLARAAKLLNSNFTIPFLILIFAGLALSPFLPRARWLAVPLATGLWLWANTASYDLRNVLGLLSICAFIPFYALARRFVTTAVISSERQWKVRDGAVAAGVAVLCVVLTLPLALSDDRLKQRFAEEQLSKGLGIELNQSIGRLLARGCTVFSADGYISTISAFQPFRNQMQFFHFTEPLTGLLAKQLTESTGCTGILYPPSRTHPSILDFIGALIGSRGYTKITEHYGMELLVSGQPSGFQ